jgi:hypothetical protein
MIAVVSHSRQADTKLGLAARRLPTQLEQQLMPLGHEHDVHLID